MLLPIYIIVFIDLLLWINEHWNYYPYRCMLGLLNITLSSTLNLSSKRLKEGIAHIDLLFEQSRNIGVTGNRLPNYLKNMNNNINNNSNNSMNGKNLNSNNVNADSSHGVNSGVNSGSSHGGILSSISEKGEIDNGSTSGGSSNTGKANLSTRIAQRLGIRSKTTTTDTS